jgi:hypothetical protein
MRLSFAAFLIDPNQNFQELCLSHVRPRERSRARVGCDLELYCTVACRRKLKLFHNFAMLRADGMFLLKKTAGKPAGSLGRVRSTISSRGGSISINRWQAQVPRTRLVWRAPYRSSAIAPALALSISFVPGEFG